MALVNFMASTAGRLLRVALGILLILVGLVVGGPVGWVIAIIGLVPIVTGAANVCLIAPLLGGRFKGSDAPR